MEGYPLLQFIMETLGEFNFGLIVAMIVTAGWITDRIKNFDEM